MTHPQSPDTDYLQERVDQLIRQTALEIGILELKCLGGVEFPGEQERHLDLVRRRFWAADDAAADNHRRPYRER